MLLVVGGRSEHVQLGSGGYLVRALVHHARIFARVATLCGIDLEYDQSTLERARASRGGLEVDRLAVDQPIDLTVRHRTLDTANELGRFALLDGHVLEERVEHQLVPKRRRQIVVRVRIGGGRRTMSLLVQLQIFGKVHR